MSIFVPLIWAQTFASPPSAGTGPGPGPGTMPGSTLTLALRRWCGSLTLSSPDPVTGSVSPGLWSWLAALGVLLTLALIAQGPRRAIGQLLDLRGQAGLFRAGFGRVRRSGRLLAMAVGVSVLAWTASQMSTYANPSGRDDLLLLVKGRRLSDVALTQGTLAALTPMRDVAGLGLMIPLLIAAAVVLFQFSTDRWGSGIRPPVSIRRRASRWATIGWGCASLYALYRFVGLATSSGELPLGGCLVVEGLVVPALMAMADGVLVAWVVVELRNAGLVETEDGDRLDPLGVSVVIPASIAACLLAFPARYLAAAVLLLAPYVVDYATPGTPLASYIRWQLGWGLVDFQAGGLVFLGLLGAVPWSRGTPRDAIRGYFRMIAADGGRLVSALAIGGLAAGAASALSYQLVLSMPVSPWALNAADSYAHYATLPIGLVLLASLVELGERSLPMASLASLDGSGAGSLDTDRGAGV